MSYSVWDQTISINLIKPFLFHCCKIWNLVPDLSTCLIVFAFLNLKFSPIFSMLKPFVSNKKKTDEIDCSRRNICKLAWLIRDWRHLVNDKIVGACSNGTSFTELLSSGFSHCPVELWHRTYYILLLFGLNTIFLNSYEGIIPNMSLLVSKLVEI